MYSVNTASTLDPAFEPHPALVIPYYTTAKKPLSAQPGWEQFYRIRYLKQTKGFEDLTEGKEQRYTQSPGSGACAYFALCSDWLMLKADAKQALLITEGELKAAKACLEGFPTIGLGGVYNFRRAKDGVFFLPELEAFSWVKRRVTIVYDSDYTEKPNICSSINALCEELQARGAMVELASLDDVYEDGRKTGLDDMLVEQGDPGLLAALRDAEPLSISRELWRMNKEVCYVANPGMVIDLSDNQKIAAANFSAHSEWATRDTAEKVVDPKGVISYEKISAAPAWIKWPYRNACKTLTYQPGSERYIEGPPRQYNTWEGWGCVPKKGDITPWKKLIEFIFSEAEPDFVEWFLDWCAYPLQNPGTKMFSAVVVHGDTQGTGKSLIGYTLGKIYGKNFTKIESKNLKRDFNGWAENKQFVLADEISGSDKRSESDMLKNIITQEVVEINIKMLPTYFVPDCINYYFTSNHADAFFIEDKDRRYAIHEVVHDAPLPFEFYQSFDAWKDGAGPAALFHFLLQRDLAGFNPKGPAPTSAAKKRMTLQGKSDAAMWVHELKETPSALLKLGQLRHQRDLFTAKDLLPMYEASSGVTGKLTVNGLSRLLKAAGFKQVLKGNPIPALGVQGRYFAVRNIDKWMRVKNHKELVKHIELQPVK